jgi:hypothetical protein
VHGSVLLTVLGILLLVGGSLLVLVRMRNSRPVIKFGHAFPHPKDMMADPVGEAAGVLDGTAPLGPRDPHSSSVVWKAEEWLGIVRAKRPVYAYVGCLHPKLGRIGFIVAQEWFNREPHGVTRCDTGGLAGRVEGFRYLDENEARIALAELSHAPTHPWKKDLIIEVRGAFGEFRRYLSGHPPNPNSYADVRQKCIDSVRRASEELDRRLWTWEARCFARISVEDVEAVVLAPEAAKELTARLDGELPTNVDFLIGHVTGSGVHYFLEDQVVAAFERRRA